MRAIETCRTPVLGGRVDVCDQCGQAQIVCHSCRNRHCPTCQSMSQARWIEGRLRRLLPTSYFHVVFTVPDAPWPLTNNNDPCTPYPFFGKVRTNG